MEYIQTHIASRIIGKGKKGGAGSRIHGYLTVRGGEWISTADLIDDKYTEMVLFVSQVLELGISELWEMNYPDFLRLLSKADEIAESRLKQIEKVKK